MVEHDRHLNSQTYHEDLPGARKAYAEALRLTQKLPEGLSR